MPMPGVQIRFNTDETALRFGGNSKLLCAASPVKRVVLLALRASKIARVTLSICMARSAAKQASQLDTQLQVTRAISP